MVGGIIIGITRAEGRSTRLNVQGQGCEFNDTRQVIVNENQHVLNLGDAIWWQCGKAYWSPKFNGDFETGSRDIPIEMVSHS